MQLASLGRRFLALGAPLILAAAMAGCSSGSNSVPAGPATGQSAARVAEPLSALGPLSAGIASGHIRQVCADHGPGTAHCLALQNMDFDPSTYHPQPETYSIPYSAAALQNAYGLTSLVGSGGKGMTVVVVDSCCEPNIVSDLAKYRSTYGLPKCGTSNKCFQVLNENGGTQLPTQDQGWGLEEALDTDMVSANCPLCKIILIEATTESNNDLYTAELTALKLGNAVSNSWGEGEYNGEQNDAKKYFSKSGVAITASAGDSGYGVIFPGASNTLAAAGGTSLAVAKNKRGWTETVWGPNEDGGTGGGCSQFISQPSWQAPVVKKLGGGCKFRVDNDIAYVANPYTGVAVYDTYQYNGFVQVGGTSVSSPALASIFALSGNIPSGVPAKLSYEHASELNDVTSGSSGSCSPKWLCNAGKGYDGPTGNGTPNGNNGLDSF